MKMNDEVRRVMDERFGHDNMIALGTVFEGIPYVRAVNAYYEDEAFYVVTYALSNKMQHIAVNPTVAICGDWFTAHGQGMNWSFEKEKKYELLDQPFNHHWREKRNSFPK